MIYIGIDPSLRHTGFCLRNTDNPDELITHEVKTKTRTMSDSIYQIKLELADLLVNNNLNNDTVIFSIERQIPNAAGASGGVLFLVYMSVIEIIKIHHPHTVNLISPYPVQLKSYMAKMHGVKNINNKKSIIERCEQLTGHKYSDHIAESWFLTLMAEDILRKNWQLSFKKTRYKLFPKDWRVHGEE